MSEYLAMFRCADENSLQKVDLTIIYRFEHDVITNFNFI